VIPGTYLVEKLLNQLSEQIKFSEGVIDLNSLKNLPSDEFSLSDKVPLFNVVIRTQGKRNILLHEAIDSLVNQSESNFRIILVVHTQENSKFLEIIQLMERFTEKFKFEPKILQAFDGGRSRPLNLALQNLDGKAVAFLDDDDLVHEDWIQNFKSIFDKNSAAIMRCFAESKQYSAEGNLIEISTEELDLGFCYPWNLAEHLVFNRTPIHCFALPTSALRRFKLSFDENLDTNEDWDFLVRAANYLEVIDTLKISAVYRQWSENSSSEISGEVWEKNRNKLLKSFEDKLFILNGAQLGSYYRRQLELEDEIAQLKWDYRDLRNERDHLHELIVFYKNSLSFKASYPIRFFGKLVKALKR